MKKLLVIASVAMVTLGFVSCKKDHTCECKFTVGGIEQTQTSEIKDKSKKDAKDACKGLAAGFNANAQGMGSASCELK